MSSLRMERFNVIFSKTFCSSQEAIDYCQHLSHACGFSVRIRTSKSNTIYIVCSREGRPEVKGESHKKRNRVSERCNCKWKVVLYYNSNIAHPAKWEFRSGKIMHHNHSVFDDEEIYAIPNFQSTTVTTPPAIPSASVTPPAYPCFPSQVATSSLKLVSYPSTFVLPPIPRYSSPSSPSLSSDSSSFLGNSSGFHNHSQSLSSIRQPSATKLPSLSQALASQMGDNLPLPRNYTSSNFNLILN